jgi:hypothetical protein
MSEEHPNKEALIRRGASAILSWGVTVAEDSHDSILEDIFDYHDLGREQYIAWCDEAQSLAESATIGLKDHSTKDLWDLMDAIKEEIEQRCER